MNDTNELPQFWDSILKIMSDFLDQEIDPWFIQTEGGSYEKGPYVQVLLEHDNMILLEATSSRYLIPPLTQEQHEVMLFLGWRHFPEEIYPNYSRILDRSTTTSREIAELLAKTLHFAYGVNENFVFATSPEYRSVNPTAQDRKANVN